MSTMSLSIILLIFRSDLYLYSSIYYFTITLWNDATTNYIINYWLQSMIGYQNLIKVNFAEISKIPRWYGGIELIERESRKKKCKMLPSTYEFIHRYMSVTCSPSMKVSCHYSAPVPNVAFFWLLSPKWLFYVCNVHISVDM